MVAASFIPASAFPASFVPASGRFPHEPIDPFSELHTSGGGHLLPPVPRHPAMQVLLVGSQTRPEVAPPQSPSVAQPQVSEARQTLPAPEALGFWTSIPRRARYAAIMARRKAREALVALGTPAVPSLIQLLSHRKPHVRWEAAKAIGGIGDPIAAFALVNALKDRDGDVRWLAAEGLAALGRDALPPLLAALIDPSNDRLAVRGAAHHVCHVLVRKKEDLARSCGLC